MVTYICEKGKRSNQNISHPSHDHSDTEIVLSKQVAVDSDQMSEDSSEVPSHYLCEAGTIKKQAKLNSDDETCSEISENSNVPSHYLSNHKKCVAKTTKDIDSDDISSQSSENSGVPSHYLREAGHHHNRRDSFSLNSPSSECVSLCSGTLLDSISNNNVVPQKDFNKSNGKPPNLFILKESSSVPLLTPKTVNPLFARPSLGDSLNFMQSTDKTKLTQKLPKMSNQQSSGNRDAPSHYFCADKCSKRKASLSPYFTHFQADSDDGASQCSNGLHSDSNSIDASLLSVSNNSLNLFAPNVDQEVLFTPLTSNPLFGSKTRPSLTDSFRFMPLSTQPVNEIAEKENFNQITENDDVFSQQSGSIDSSSDNSKMKHSLSPYYEKATGVNCSSDVGDSQNKDANVNDGLSHITQVPAASKTLDLSLHDTSNPEVLCTPKITNPVFTDNFKLDLTDLPTTTICKETNGVLRLDFEENELENYDTDSLADTCPSFDVASSDLGYWK